jgi:predicted enzyme related to lactoylglutathione lyase
VNCDTLGMLRRRLRRPDLTIGVIDLDRMVEFFEAIGWTVTADVRVTVVATPGGAIGLRREAEPARLEIALSVADALHVDELAEVVETAGGIVMEPPQETAWGGWGFSFNDPDGNTWEIGSPYSVTAVDARFSTGAKVTGPIVALAVPRRRLPETV